MVGWQRVEYLLWAQRAYDPIVISIEGPVPLFGFQTLTEMFE